MCTYDFVDTDWLAGSQIPIPQSTAKVTAKRCSGVPCAKQSVTGDYKGSIVIFSSFLFFPQSNIPVLPFSFPLPLNVTLTVLCILCIRHRRLRHSELHKHCFHLIPGIIRCRKWQQYTRRSSRNTTLTSLVERAEFDSCETGTATQRPRVRYLVPVFSESHHAQHDFNRHYGH